MIFLIVSLGLISIGLNKNRTRNNCETAEVVLAQPNIDPYNEKFSGEGNLHQLKKCIGSVDGKIDIHTDLLITPETTIPIDLWEKGLDSTIEIKYLRNYLSQYPKLSLLVGASTSKLYNSKETVTARPIPNSPFYYDSYNTAIEIENAGALKIYHKSKLVPGVEIIPFPGVMKYFEKYAIDLGGTIGSLGIQNERTVFTNQINKIKAAPIICYESIYGEFVSKYVQNGANLLCIITNDGWWEDTPGYRQHLSYAKLRAIENRRYIARSANTGISAFIDDKGEILQQSKWWEVASLKGKVKLNTELTFYTKHGDYIYKSAVFICCLILILSVIFKLKIKNEDNN
jgi:apolipoprotein N-acyltransferase